MSWKRSSVKRSAVCVLGSVFALGASASMQEPADAGASVAVHLSVRRPDRVHPVARLVVESGAPEGRAAFFVAAPGDGSVGASPRFWSRLGREPLAGRLAGWARCDEEGRAAIELSGAALSSGARVRALVLPREGALARAGASASVTLLSLDGRSESASGPTVVVTEILKDPTVVSDSAGEWFELFNPGPGPVDIAGWVLSDLGSESTVLSNGGLRMVVPAHKHVVLGRNADPLLNGGVPVTWTYSSFTLSNTDDEVQLSRPDGTLVDLVAYDDGILWPDLPGRSISLDPDFRDVIANNDPLHWCHSLERLFHGSTDTGTPTKRNEDCP
jgi:hypothetical protein